MCDGTVAVASVGDAQGVLVRMVFVESVSCCVGCVFQVFASACQCVRGGVLCSVLAAAD